MNLLHLSCHTYRYRYMIYVHVCTLYLCWLPFSTKKMGIHAFPINHRELVPLYSMILMMTLEGNRKLHVVWVTMRAHQTTGAIALEFLVSSAWIRCTRGMSASSLVTNFLSDWSLTYSDMGTMIMNIQYGAKTLVMTSAGLKSNNLPILAMRLWTIAQYDHKIYTVDISCVHVTSCNHVVLSLKQPEWPKLSC